MSDAHCPECGHYCADVIGQPCLSCFWRLKNERRDRAMGEAAARAAKEEAMKINLRRDIQASLDKIEALTAEVEGLREGLRDEEQARDWFKGKAKYWKGEAHEIAEQRDAYKAQRDELAAQIDAMEKRTIAVYDGCSGLTEENEELREEVRRLTEVSLGLAAIVAGKG